MMGGGRECLPLGSCLKHLIYASKTLGFARLILLRSQGRKLVDDTFPEGFDVVESHAIDVDHS